MRMIDADVITDWLLQEIRAKDGAFSGMLGRQAANMIGKKIDEAPTVAKDIKVPDKWVSVKDRLPDKSGIYIICDHYGNVMSRHFCKQHGRFAGYWHFNGSAKYGNPLYWMPLPEPPKEET